MLCDTPQALQPKYRANVKLADEQLAEVDGILLVVGDILLLVGERLREADGKLLVVYAALLVLGEPQYQVCDKSLVVGDR